ncbi:uncharacterized protein KY384_004533 [Bacidia gigantensis]|uniref:uncharacterized protein n=1 Tax=Bacidia gigantensis TaxID=2732470 RepID=UPI001D0584DE|nr:uncharacterized protein KY384_004533 [Bacidia gigantensis]KAG8531175.1 hypothetical protein KY384_004533 [Bacidia gigantensis]
MVQGDPFRPAARVAGQKLDVWTIVNEGAANSPVQPIVNMGQGFFGYNPPKYVTDAAKEALNRVDCNQYAPTKGRPRLKKAIAEAYKPIMGKPIDPDREVVITTGANEGMLSAFMAFLEPGDEVILFEPFFDQYISNIKMAGANIRYVPLTPPANGAQEKTSSADWLLNADALKSAITPKTRIIVLNTPHNPLGKIFNPAELSAIASICVENNILLISDEVYDRLPYVPFTRPASLNDEIAKLTLTVGSAGKNFYCTGWRVGWLIGPENLIKHVATAHTRICYSTVGPLQEAAAVGFEQADKEGFWEQSKNDMLGKMKRFCSVFDELGLPYSEPEGGYFVLANFSKVKLPSDYNWPEQVKDRPRDFKLSWFLITEVGVAAIPPTEFYTPENQHFVEDWLRFAVCKEDDVLEKAEERLRGLKKYILDTVSQKGLTRAMGAVQASKMRGVQNAVSQPAYSISLNLIAQGSIALISLTATVNDGNNYNTTYLRSGQVVASNLTCYFSNKTCPISRAATNGLAHSYGEAILAPDCGGFNQLNNSGHPSQNWQYYCRYPPAEDADSQAFGYRFKEYNPADKQNLYPRFTNRRITAFSGDCRQYSVIGQPQNDTIEDMSATQFTYTNGSYNGSISIPNSALGLNGTTYLYRGFNSPENATDFLCGDRCLLMWAYKNKGGDQGRTFFECPITVSTVTNATSSDHAVRENVARVAAASIALQGRYTDANTRSVPPDQRDFYQSQYYAEGHPWEIHGQSPRKVGANMAQSAIGAISTMVDLNPQIRIAGTVPYLGSRVIVKWKYFEALMACIVAAHSVVVALNYVAIKTARGS